MLFHSHAKPSVRFPLLNSTDTLCRGWLFIRILFFSSSSSSPSYPRPSIIFSCDSPPPQYIYFFFSSTRERVASLAVIYWSYWQDREPLVNDAITVVGWLLGFLFFCTFKSHPLHPYPMHRAQQHQERTQQCVSHCVHRPELAEDLFVSFGLSFL